VSTGDTVKAEGCLRYFGTRHAFGRRPTYVPTRPGAEDVGAGAPDSASTRPCWTAQTATWARDCGGSSHLSRRNAFLGRSAPLAIISELAATARQLLPADNSWRSGAAHGER
jgi:hypothetical protein